MAGISLLHEPQRLSGRDLKKTQVIFLAKNSYGKQKATEARSTERVAVKQEAAYLMWNGGSRPCREACQPICVPTFEICATYEAI